MIRKILILALFVAVIISFIYWKNVIAGIVIERIVKSITGCRLTVESVDISFLKTKAEMQELLILNPKDFPDRIMFDAPLVYIDFNIPALFKRKIHLKEVTLDIREVAIVKDARGNLNLNSLKVVKAEKTGKEPEDIGPRKAPEMRIDKFILKIKKVSYKDYTKGPSPRAMEFTINVNESFTGVNDLYDLTNIVVVKAVKRAALGQIVGVNIEALTRPISKTLETVKVLGAKITNVTKEASKQTVDATGKTLKEVQKMFQDKTRSSAEEKPPKMETDETIQ
jgi:uncharacterized protein involved in outer membrane biogenesis